MGKPDRKAILAKLRQLFESQGYTGTGMAEISKATKLGRGSLYHLFPDGKGQMMREVLAAAEADFTRAVVAPLEEDNVSGMFTGLKEFFENGEKQSLWGRLIHDASARDFTDEIREHYSNWRTALTKALLNAGIERGMAASLSERTLSGVEGTLSMAAGFEDAGALSRGLRTMSSEITDAVAASAA